jgi:Flp pilus assembly pilin Flp
MKLSHVIDAPNATRSASKLIRDERGATLMEYIMLAGLIAIAAFAGFRTFGTDVQTAINSQATSVTTIPVTP